MQNFIDDNYEHEEIPDGKTIIRIHIKRPDEIEITTTILLGPVADMTTWYLLCMLAEHCEKNPPLYAMTDHSTDVLEDE